MAIRRVFPAGLLGMALVIGVASPVGAAGPDTGVHNDGTYATVDLTTGGLWDCGEGQEAAGASISLALNDGLRSQNPIGSGMPHPWLDTDPYLQVFGCDGAGWGFSFHSLDLTSLVQPTTMNVDGFTSATMHVEIPMYNDEGAPTGVTMAFDLDWTATGMAVVDSHPAAGSTRFERKAPAVVNGSLVVGGLQGLWPELPQDSVTFDTNSADASTDNTFIGRWLEVQQP
jgi:hypothetical protein